MAQHDYVIDNSTGANVRADINSVLQAIASNNSGSSAPSTTYAFQLFANTTTSKLQIRNAANNAFVDLLSLDGNILLADGSASSPSLSFSDDTNTGIFSSAADTFNIATAGNQRLIINSDGNVAIGTTTTISNDSEHNKLVLSGRSGTAGGILIFQDTSNNEDGMIFADNGSLILAADRANATGSSFMAFRVDGSSEKMRLDSDGRLHIGNSGFSATTSSDDLTIGNLTGEHGITIFSATDSAGFICFGDTNTTGVGSRGGVIRYEQNDNSMRFATNGNNERMRLNSTGFLQYNNATDIGGIFQLTANGVVNLSGNKLARFNFNSTGDVTGIEMRHARGGLSGFSGKIISFTGNDGTEEGSININVTSTSYNTSSDYRLKENETAISDGIVKLKQLKPYRFNFKKDPDVKVDGFFAHEVVPVVPNAVTGEKDAMEAETRYEEGDTIPEGKVIGDPKTFSTTKISPQQLDHSKLVPLLVAAVQELIVKVEALEAA